MKFCKYCGSPLEDNAVCTCTKAQAEYAVSNSANASQPAPTSAQPNSITQPVKQDSVYATVTTPKPAGDGKFVKAIKNLPVSFISYFKNSKEVLSTAKREKDWLLSLLYIAVQFISLIIFGCCVSGKLDSFISSITSSLYGANDMIKTFNFGNIFLHSLIMTVLINGFYTIAEFALIKIFNRTSDTKTTFIESFIDAAINSIPIIPIFVIGGIFSFLSPFFIIFTVIFVLIFYIALLVSSVNTKVPEPKNPALFNLITVLFIVIAVTAIAFAFYQMLIAAVQSIFSSTMSNLNNVGNHFFNGLSDIFQ